LFGFLDIGANQARRMGAQNLVLGSVAGMRAAIFAGANHRMVEAWAGMLRRGFS